MSRPRLAFVEAIWRASVVLQGWAVGLILAGIVVLSLISVVMRYVLTASISWADEATRLLFIFGSFLGAGLAVAYGSHLVVDTLIDKSDPGSINGRIWRAAIGLTSVTFFVLLIVGGADQAGRNFGQASPAIRVPLGYVYLAVPIGATIMLINHIGVLLFGPLRLPVTDSERPTSSEASSDSGGVV